MFERYTGSVPGRFARLQGLGLNLKRAMYVDGVVNTYWTRVQLSPLPQGFAAMNGYAL